MSQEKVYLATKGQVEAVQLTASETKTNVATVNTNVLATKTEATTAKTNAANAVTAANNAKTAADNAKTAADAAKTAIDETKVQVEDVKDLVTETKVAVETADAKCGTVLANLDAMNIIMSRQRLARVTVRLNPTGSTYSLPSDPEERAKLLDGARIFFKEQGIDHPYEARVTSLVNFSVTFQVYVTDVSRTTVSTAYCSLGKSETSGYIVAPNQTLLSPDSDITIDLTTAAVSGQIVEMCRVQPWVANPSDSTDAAAKTGVSFIGTRITDSSGTTLHLGHYASDGTTWVNQSLTKVVVWNCPSGGEPEARILEGSSEYVDLMERLAVLRNLKEVTVKFRGATADHPAMKAIRFSPCFIKHEVVRMNLQIDNGDGTMRDNWKDCAVTWYCDSDIDGTYHRMPLFEQYERDTVSGIVSAIPKDYGLIARYPISNSQNLAVVEASGATNIYSCARAIAGEGRDHIPGNRGVTLERAKPLNKTTITISADGEDDIVIPPDTSDRARNVAIAGTREISFIQNMAYLFFGVNPQGAVSGNTKQEKDNIYFAGICTSDGTNSTTNGDTDYMMQMVDPDSGRTIWNAAANTKRNDGSLVFLGIEDAVWSSTGWYHENVTMVTRRTITTDENGTILSNSPSAHFLYCLDNADLRPISGIATVDNNSPVEITDTESASFEGTLKANGYQEMPSAISSVVTTQSSLYRVQETDRRMIRDAFFPTDNQSEANINMGGCDTWWRRDIPDTIKDFGTGTTYSEGAYCKKDGKLWKAIAAHPAGAWDDSHFEAVASKSVVQRSYWLVALGNYRSFAGSLGVFPVSSNYTLSYSGGSFWRARLSLF